MDWKYIDEWQHLKSLHGAIEQCTGLESLCSALQNHFYTSEGQIATTSKSDTGNLSELKKPTHLQK